MPDPRTKDGALDDYIQRCNEEEKQRKKEEAAATLRTVGPLTFAIVTGGQLLNQSRPALVRNIVSDQAAPQRCSPLLQAMEVPWSLH